VSASVLDHGPQVYRGSKAATVSAVSLSTGLQYTEIFGSKAGEIPMTCGLFTVMQGDATPFKYPCAEYTIVLDGTHILDPSN
jgi:hypothetical protein